MSHPDTDRNLLFGVIAVQMGFCTEPELVAGMKDWMLHKDLPLGEVLVRRGALQPRCQELLDRVVAEHVAAHDQDASRSLSAMRAEARQRFEASEAVLAEFAELLAELAETILPESAGVGEPQRPWPSGGPATGSGAPPRVAGGRFQVERLHREGGLGRVMVAKDLELRRRVALKEIKPDHVANEISQERFVVEALVTGGLEHPGIVPVYSLGQYPDGSPYYAMRFIRGDNLANAIRRFHDQNLAHSNQGKYAIELRKLLRRFIDVCHAVQYAHSRKVLHRDLKPSNIMLGGFGETLVVDWGLAKVVGGTTDRPSSEDSATKPPAVSSYATEAGSVIGTPAYMSPEQAEGRLEELSYASDVYSLGATLYCLLTGRAPFVEQDQEGREGLRQRVIRGDFPPPRALKPEIPRPLEAICLKAMRRVPAERYRSPRMIVTDLEHWLADEPVSAYRERRGERLARWMRRHRGLVRGGLLALVTIAAAAVTAAILILRAWQQEATAWNAAEQRFVQAREAVDKWLTGVGEALRYYPSTAKARNTLLEQAAEDYERFARQCSPDKGLEIERGRTLLRLGHVRMALVDVPGAEQAYGAARELFEQLAAQFPQDPDCQTELANCHTDLGVLAMEQKRVAEADELYRAALSRLQPLVAARAAIAPRRALATARLNRGELLSETGRHEEATRELQQCIELLTELTAELDGTSSATPAVVPDSQAGQRLARETQLALANARDLLGRVWLDRGQYQEALSAMQAAIGASTKLADAEPDNPQYLEARAVSQIYLATVLRLLGRLDDEAQAYRRAIADYTALCTALPGVALFEESRAITQLDSGNLLYKQGRVVEAETDLSQARTVLARLVRDHPDFARYREALACCDDNLSELRRERGDFDRAEELSQQAIQAFEELLQGAGEDGGPQLVKCAVSLAVARSHLGQVLHRRGKHAEADRAFAAAIDGLMPQAGDMPDVRDKLAAVYLQRAELLTEMGKPAEARTACQQAKDLWHQLAAAAGAAAEHRANYAWLLANCLSPELRDPLAAVQIAEQLVAEVPANATYHTLLGAARHRTGAAPSALAALREAIRLRVGDHGRDWLFLALAHGAAKEREQGLKAYHRGVQWVESNLPESLELRRLQREAEEVLRPSGDEHKPAAAAHQPAGAERGK
jgi:serine/threonine-protein kinase